MDSLVERLRHLAAQIDPCMVGGPDARLLTEAAAIIAELIERVEGLEAALKPFASHIGKVDAPVVLKIGANTWTNTLTGHDFARANHVLNLRHDSYKQWLVGPQPPSVLGKQEGEG